MSGSSQYGKTRPLAVVAAAMDEDIRAAAKTARGLGFAALQLDVRLGDLDLTELSQSGRREVRSVLRSSDLDLAGLRLDLGARGLGPGADIDAALDRVEKILEVSSGLQCSLVCVELGPLPHPPPSEKSKARISAAMAGDIIVPSIAIPAPNVTNLHDIPPKLDPTFAATVDGALAELGQRADRHGVTIAFRSELASLPALDRALRTAACSWFGVDLDPAATLRDDWSSDEIFSHLGPMIRHVRGRDAVLGADRRTKAAVVGQGSVQWQQLLGGLDAAGYHGWITLDSMELPNRSAAAATGAAALKKL
jgi:sugar phosphate isomerase/epimerase